jgi:iron complex transport system substrate-binding protein
MSLSFFSRIFSFSLLLFLFLPFLARAEITLHGADGHAIVLPQPAQRIVTLAPNLTDILLTLGAADQIVGVSDDHESRGIYRQSLSGFPVVSDSAAVNYEKLLALHPDLVLAWSSGTPQAWVEKIRQLGIPVFMTGAPKLSDIAHQIRQIGVLSGRQNRANQQAGNFTRQMQDLQKRYGDGPRVKYFYQVWSQPLYSLSASHLLSQALALCAADNIIAPGPIVAPLINPEFVLQQNPEVIMFAKAGADNSRAYWSRFTGLQAVSQQHLLAVDDKRLTRPGPDIVSAVTPVCAQLAQWRRAGAAKLH